jgi:hypothetical protein
MGVDGCSDQHEKKKDHGLVELSSNGIGGNPHQISLSNHFFCGEMERNQLHSSNPALHIPLSMHQRPVEMPPSLKSTTVTSIDDAIVLINVFGLTPISKAPVADHICYRDMRPK